MKKITLFMVVAFFFLLISSSVSYFLKYTSLNEVACILFAGSLIVLSIFIAIIYRKYLFAEIASMVLNGVAVGFAIRCWHIHRNLNNSLFSMIFVAIICIGIIVIFYLLLSIPFFDKHCLLAMILYSIIVLIVYILMVVFLKESWISTLGFSLIIVLAYIIGLCVDTPTFGKAVSVLNFCSFSAIVVAILVAIIVFSEGDALDFDLSDLCSDISSPRKKQIKMPYEEQKGAK